MAEVVAVLSTSWRLISAIGDIVSRIKQTREDARALMYLEEQARSFLIIVNEGLVGVDTSPYLSTILSLERLLQDILTVTKEYIRMNTLSQLLNANMTRKNILELNRRLRLFVDTYLLQTTTQAARVNLAVLANPAPAAVQVTLIEDDIQWELMSRSTATTISPQARVDSWMQDVQHHQPDTIRTNEIITTEPRRSPSPIIPGARHPQVQDRNMPPSHPAAWCDEWKTKRLAPCYNQWLSSVCPFICRHTLCVPIRLPVCIADCIGRFTCRAPHGHGCCTVCIFEHCLPCMPEICFTDGPPGDVGVACAVGISQAEDLHWDECGDEYCELQDDECKCICTYCVGFPTMVVCTPAYWTVVGMSVVIDKWHSMCCSD